MTRTTDAQVLGLDGDVDVDRLVRAVVGWHFDPATGSEFWLRIAAELDFDPRADVHTAADLTNFPDVSAHLAQASIDDLVPRGCAGPVRVFESGGTTGAPKRIVETGSRARALGFVSDTLRAHGIGQVGHWLHVGPTGPHIVGRSVGLLAEARGSTCYYVDFDPRWVRRLVAGGDPDSASSYVEHVLDQVAAVLRNQRVRVVVITPPVLEAALARPELATMLGDAVRALIWTGTSMSEESLRLVTEEFLPGATVVGLYGNSLMGIAPQRPPTADDPFRCVFTPYHPYAVVDVVDPETGVGVAHGERGRVRVNLLTRDMFLPNVAERDTAVRVAGHGGAPDGLAGVQPYRGGTEPVIEGVY